MTCARDLGATRTAIIDAQTIAVRKELADLCREPRCENYGRSPGCPPHVGGPAAIRQELKHHRQALFFSLEVPLQVLFTDTRRECFQLLHKIAAGIETQAKTGGRHQAHAYVGGSCKEIFCHAHAECRVLAGTREGCRHPNHARPSMSGLGIDVARLTEAAGWGRRAGSLKSEGTATGMANLYGLILLD